MLLSCVAKKMMDIKLVQNALVITPTTGGKHLQQAMESVAEQTAENVDHLIVIDGPKYQDDTYNQLDLMNESKVTNITLPWNVGGDGGSWYGHRTYAAVSKLVPTKYDYVFLLDEDNWYDNHHVQNCIDAMQQYPTMDFCHSLRTIRDENGTWLCNDDCESLGAYPTFQSGVGYHVDTSSYCFKRDFFRHYGHIWDAQWGADRRFFNFCRSQKVNFISTGKYTLNYRLDGNEGSVKWDFFKIGNDVMLKKYGEERNFPWKNLE